MALFERAVLEVLEPRTLAVAVVLLLVFTASSITGYLYANSIMESSVGDILKDQTEGLKRAAENPLLLPLIIFVNNVRVSLLVALLYPTIIVPFIVISLNGLVLGLLPSGLLIETITSELEQLGSEGAAFIYYSFLVPHGVLEIPTIALVGALVASGFRGGLRGVAGRIVRRVALAAVNLAVAAIVETTLTIAVGAAAALLVYAIQG